MQTQRTKMVFNLNPAVRHPQNQVSAFAETHCESEALPLETLTAEQLELVLLHVLLQKST